MLFKRCRFFSLFGVVSLIVLFYYITHSNKKASSPQPVAVLTTSVVDDLEEIELTEEDRQFAREKLISKKRYRYGPFVPPVKKETAVRIDSIGKPTINKSIPGNKVSLEFKSTKTSNQSMHRFADLITDKKKEIKPAIHHSLRNNLQPQNEMSSARTVHASTTTTTTMTSYYKVVNSSNIVGKKNSHKTISYGKEIIMEASDVHGMLHEDKMMEFPPLSMNSNTTNHILHRLLKGKSHQGPKHIDVRGATNKDNGIKLSRDKGNQIQSEKQSFNAGKRDILQVKENLNDRTPPMVNRIKYDSVYNHVNKNVQTKSSKDISRDESIKQADVLFAPKFLSGRQLQQLNQIENVKEELSYLHGLMQGDRFYYQYNKSKGIRQTKYRLESYKKFHDKLKRPMLIPIHPPSHQHGYPIEVRSANFMPSPDRLEPTAIIREYDTRIPSDFINNQSVFRKEEGNPGSDDIASILNTGPDRFINYDNNSPDDIFLQSLVHPNGDLLNGEIIQEHNIDYKPIRSMDNENLLYELPPEKNPDVNPTIDDDFRRERLGRQSWNANMASRVSGNIANVHTLEPATMTRRDNAQMSLHVKDMTTQPSNKQGEFIMNKELKYEHLPDGDLTVYNVPNNVTPSIKARKIANANKHKQMKDWSESKHFLMKVSASQMSNDSVSTAVAGIFSKPKDVRRINKQWQIHGDRIKVFLYSAYYDDRPGLERQKIRIISIANADVTSCYCLMWYKGQSKPDVAVAVFTKIGAKIQPVSKSEDKYEPYIITCATHMNKGNAPPEQVSVITMDNHTITTLLDVQIPIKPASANERIEIGQCMSVVYWHKDPEQLVEWLEANRMWGVGEITVYGNQLSTSTNDIFNYYAKEGYVDFRQMPNILNDYSEFTILLNMSPAINDCMYRNMYRYKRIICTDIDELLVPRQAMNYTAMIDQILQKSSNKHPHPAFMFRNVYFFTDFEPIAEEPWFLRSMRYLKHIKPSEFGYSVKSITDPQSCIALQNHLCWKRMKKYEGKNWTIDVPVELGRLQHYKKCHFDSYLRQLGACKRLMKDYFIDHNLKRFESTLYTKAAQKLVELKIAAPA